MPDEIIVVSTPYLPGYRITKTVGFMGGLIVRSRGLGRNITAGSDPLPVARTMSTPNF